MTLIKTSLYGRHQTLNAKFSPFAGFLMPIHYSSIKREHNAVRHDVGLFDVSHMGEIFISGKNALEFVQKITINDAADLEIGQAQYSAMCNNNGGIVDDLLVYRFGNHFMMVVNASNIKKDLDWLKKNLIEGVEIKDMSDRLSLIALQGPKSRALIMKSMPVDISDLTFYRFVEIEIFGTSITIARTGYTGELGFEIYGDNETIPHIWDILMNSGKAFSLEPVGLAARDTLRMEMKYCLYGNDIDEKTNPIEAGLSWITKLDKGEFTGRDAIAESKISLTRRLVCFEMEDRAIPRQGYHIFKDGSKIGIVTSGTHSPSIGKGIGMAYINKPFTKSGNEITVEIRGKYKHALIVKPPFYKNGTALI
ncbi:MAG: glycine cleavage system aminomethyltransferase GcvT [Candidatus Neomarinimicrobiota bacterium]